MTPPRLWATVKFLVSVTSASGVKRKDWPGSLTPNRKPSARTRESIVSVAPPRSTRARSPMPGARPPSQLAPSA